MLMENLGCEFSFYKCNGSTSSKKLHTFGKKKSSKMQDEWSVLSRQELLLITSVPVFQVNLSVAIIPMAHQYGWNSSTAGLVQSSFFWGFALSQLPGGWLAKLFGGRLVVGGNKSSLNFTK